MATDKLIDEITVKLSTEQKKLLVGLAEVKGSNASEVVRAMIDRYISEQKREFDSMKSIFGSDQEGGKV
jgi:predicted DNA-binding protein